MPALELAQETGKILKWLKSPGDTVSKGEPLVEIGAYVEQGEVVMVIAEEVG